MLFIKEKRSEYCGTEKGEGRSFTEIMRHLAELWKTLTPEQKMPYIEKSNVDKQRHESEKTVITE
jgi:hypothetical protein